MFVLSRPMKKSSVWFALWLTIVATAGCDASMPTSSSAPRGEARTEKLKTNFTVDEARELAQPASSTPGLSVDVQGAQNAGVGSENFNGALENARGLNTQRLFGTAAGGDDERFERLENAVQQLRDDFDKVAPSVNRLISIEREIQTLVDQLQLLVENDNSVSTQTIPPVSASTIEEEFPVETAAAQSPPIPLAPPLSDVPAPPAESIATPETAKVPAPSPAPAPQAPAPQPVVTTPVQSATVSSEVVLTSVRIADHAKTARVVFETTRNVPYTVDVDPEKILIVTFAQGSAGSNIAASKTNSSMVKSIDQTPQNAGGFIVAMPLTKMTKIVRQGVLKPDDSNKNYRIYIDLER